MGCEALGLMGVRECYVMDNSNQSVSTWVRHQKAVRGLEANLDYWGVSGLPAPSHPPHSHTPFLALHPTPYLATGKRNPTPTPP